MLQELQKAAELTGSGPVFCILDHPGFDAACLNPWVLEIVWRQYKSQYHQNPVDGPQNKRYRHIAYRQLVRMVWKFLGPHIRVPLPACAVTKIRSTFPNVETGQEYVGFKFPDLV